MKHPKQYDTTPAISQRMAHVRLKKGKAEMMLAKKLWHQGLRYRLNYKNLPGSPDITVTKHKLAVFVDGEFWHGYQWEERKPRLKVNREYWIEKIEENIARDKRNDALLAKEGWICLHFWEKEVLKDTDACVQKVMATVKNIVR